MALSGEAMSEQRNFPKSRQIFQLILLLSENPQILIQHTQCFLDRRVMQFTNIPVMKQFVTQECIFFFDRVFPDYRILLPLPRPVLGLSMCFDGMCTDKIRMLFSKRTTAAR